MKSSPGGSGHRIGKRSPTGSKKAAIPGIRTSPTKARQRQGKQSPIRTCVSPLRSPINAQISTQGIYSSFIENVIDEHHHQQGETTEIAKSTSSLQIPKLTSNRTDLRREDEAQRSPNRNSPLAKHYSLGSQNQASDGSRYSISNLEAESAGNKQVNKFQNESKDFIITNFQEYLESLGAAVRDEDVSLPKYHAEGMNDQQMNEEAKESVDVQISSVTDNDVSSKSFQLLLPLDAYDNKNLETMDLSKLDFSSTVHGLVAVYSANKTKVEWKSCTVNGYNSASDTFDVHVLESGNSLSDVPRIDLLLIDSDDPLRFGKRIAAAWQMRKDAEALLRYHLYIDCMPSDDLYEIEASQWQRICKMAKVHTDGTLLKVDKRVDIVPLSHEIQIAYYQSMNKLVFDQKLNETSSSSLSLDLCLPVDSKPKEVPWYGNVPVVPYLFNKARDSIHSNSFISKSYLLKALQNIHVECQDVMDLEVFIPKLDKILSIKEFEHQQRMSIDSAAKQLKSRWVSTIKNHIKEAFNNSTEPIWDLEERNQEVYDQSDLKRFFVHLNLIMADVLRDMTEANVARFAKLMKSTTGCNVIVNSCSDVQVITSPQQQPQMDSTNDDSQPTLQESESGSKVKNEEPSAPFVAVFQLSLKVDDSPVSPDETTSTENDNGEAVADDGEGEGEEEGEGDEDDTQNASGPRIAYDVDVRQLADLPKELLHHGLTSLQNIIQVQRLVMDRLYWIEVPTIQAVQLNEELITNCESIMSADIQNTFPPLQEYLRTFDSYLPFARMDVDKFMQEQEDRYADIKPETPRKKSAVVEEGQDNENEGDNAEENGGENKADDPDATQGEGDREEEEEANADAENGDGDDESNKEPLDPVRIAKFVQDHMDAIQDIAKSIPDGISVGPYHVDCTGVKTFLIDKHQHIIDRLLDFVVKRSFNQSVYLAAQFNDIRVKLSRFPHNIEDLVEIKDYIALVPKIVHELEQDISKLWECYEMLESFQYPLSDEGFAIKWKVYGSPKMVADKMEATNAVLEKEKVRYASIQKEKQEDFLVFLDKLESEVSTLNQYSDLSRVDQIHKRISEVAEKLQTAQDNSILFNNRETLFGEEITDYEQVEEIAKAFAPYQSLWDTVHSWVQHEDQWVNGSFMDLDPQLVEKEVQESFKTLNRSVKFFQKNNMPNIKETAELVKARVEQFKPSLPVISSLRNPGMRDRHWNNLSKELEIELVPDSSFTLSKALSLGLQKHEDLVTKIAGDAAKEFQIERTLDKMASEWETVMLECSLYKDTGTYVLHGVDELMAILDEHITMTQAMQFSSFKAPFAEQIDSFDHKLSVMSEVIDEWIAVQRNWLYLQPIFDSPDINKQLPAEGKRFSNVDKMWRQTLSGAKANPKAIEFCSNEKLLEKFRESNMLLDMVSKGLSDYLETKRSGFSRFYFLSNDELLEILSETKDPAMVQPHLKKCFEGIKSVQFDDDQLITHMYSAEGEVVQIDLPVDPKGANVEAWMTDLELNMMDSVKKALYKSILEYVEQKRTDWIQVVPGQCALNGSQLHWTREIEEAMDAKGNEGVGDCYRQQVQQINDMVALVRDPNLKKMARMTISALTVIDVHARDVTEKLYQKGVSFKEEFLWISQMRYYWEDGEALEGDLKVMMVSSKRPYGYEYLGNSFRLVITPLTDKCYLTLMGALQMTLGGAPAGPAGTGKTETTKDLAKALAKQCVVFNCSDGLDYLAMGKFFKGLASCGAWACFDEFNRIDVEVLSVVAQQIMTLQGGVLAGQTRIVFEGTEIRLSDQFAVYITMNPGYAGRTELPDNLKARFRPVAMMVPDYALIGEIMLYSFGYEKARLCAKKMVATFKLCSEQLSSQSHYDYGMRAVKTVIVAAGNLRRDNPDEDEEILLLRALQDVNLPKFLAHDLPLFKGIISDLFPGKSRPEIDYGKLKACLRLTNESQNLQSTAWFLEKQIQLYETIVVRHGLMLVGPTGGGKSRNLENMDTTLGMLKERGVTGFAFERVHRHTVNPKSITMGQLYGQFDPNTHEWQDGILANLVRSCAKSTTPDRKWIVFDGPVDAIWIENMNTVLDDNKKLCLNSGEIMSLSAEMSMIFEVEDLEVASPATVSRVGIVYMEPATLGLDTIIQSWIQTLPSCLGDSEVQHFQNLFGTYVVGSVQFLRRNLVEPVPTVNNNIVSSLMRLLDCYLAGFKEKLANGENISDEELGLFKEDIEPLFIFSLVWSICCTCTAAGRKRFDGFIRTMMLQHSASKPFPKPGTIYDYIWSQEKRRWIEWMDTIEPFAYDKSLSFSETIVPTQDSVCYTYLLDILVRNGKHVLMTGPTGTGKTVNINRHLSLGLPSEYIPLNLTFSAQTSANQTQDLIDSKMEKRRKGVFGPPSGKQFVIFVDDFNMPQREEYGAQPPVEILRQWFTYGGWYDRKTLGFRQIIDVVMVAAMGPPGGGRNPVTARMLRHYNIIGYTALESSSMQTIFGTILSNFLNDGFEGGLGQLADPIVLATIDTYQTICRELLPTPAKSHYTYNMRDLGKVFQGMLMVTNKTITTQGELVRLWVHENRRVFKDRLVNEEDRKWFDNFVELKISEDLKMNWNKINGEDEYLVFGDLLEPQERNYRHIADMSELLPTVCQYLDEYNAESKTPMNLKLFMDALQHIARIARVIRQPMGNALLLGVGGSGRKSLSRLATYIADYELFMVEIAKGYGLADWREDIKGCLLKAGVEDKQVVFLFDDTQIIMAQMLEDINGILNAGDVPNVYAPEDMEKIMTACRGDCAKKKIPPTKLNIFAQYLVRVRQNTHVVMCMSPGTPVFRDRLRMFPALVNCCTIDWFSEWPDEALKSVGMGIMKEVDLKMGDKLEPVVELFKVFHQSVATSSKTFFDALRRYNYVTPTSYLELLNTFKSMLQEKRAEVDMKRNRLQVGLDKMISTAAQVAGLQVQLTEMQPVLAVTQKEVEEMIVQITKDKAAADETKKTVSKEEELAQEKAKATQAIADDAQRDLDEALPALDEAVKCLNLLKKADLDEVRSLKTPPSGVKLTMEAACIMFQHKGKMVGEVGKKVLDYWDVAKKELLSDPNRMLQRLFNFDKDNIPDKVIQKMHAYIDNPDFQPAAIEKASKACTAICMWSRAMYKYHHVALAVEPKRIKLAEAQEELDATMAKLQQARDVLQGVMDRINELESNYNKSLEKKEQLANEVEQCSARLERAQKLIGGLGGEKDRWTKAVEQYGIDYVNVLGDVLIASGSIAYLGPFTSEFRHKLVEEWHGYMKDLDIPHTPETNLVASLGNPVTIRAWQIAGLPADNHSTENAIVIAKARRWPLLIDPQTQANRYIKNLGKENEAGIEVSKPSNRNFIRALENGVRFGKWVLLENVGEKLDAALEPILLQQVFKQDGQDMIRLGDNTVPYNENFRFFMTTKLPNPHYPPEVAVKVSLLNFSITPVGLEEQLLGLIMANELPDLEEKKNELVKQNALMAKQLQDIGDKILYMLSNSQGNILDDAELIETLASSKTTSEEINVKVVEAKETEVEIDSTRELYRPFAYRGSILFFCISELRVIDPMYEYSLQWFSGLFVQSILDSKPSADVDERLEILKEFFTYSLYNNVCRSLFESHKLLFSFSMCVKILQGSNAINPTEWRFLISGQGNGSKDIPKPTCKEMSWVTDKAWAEICALSTLDALQGFVEEFEEHANDWKQLFDSETCYKDPLPGRWNNLDLMQKMAVLRAIRPDRITESVQNFIIHHYGQKFIEPPPFDMKMSFSASRVVTPLIFLLTAGSDPTDDFFKFSESQGMDSKTKAISLGQGQGPIAARMVEEAITSGAWVLLQNCHLCSSWMGDLEMIVEEIDVDNTHPDFRLWLTSMPTKIFPVSVLQNGVKITKEPPKGMRANLRTAYYKLGDDELKVSPKVKEFNKLLFGLCFFHALIQERRKFGPLGWNIPYEFNDTDLDISMKQLNMYLDAYEDVPYDVLNFLTSYINYGGRVTDAIDLRTIDVILKDFYSEKILNDGYAFSPSGIYYSCAVNEDSPQESYVKYIESLPVNAEPEVFGLHSNANISCALEETYEMFDLLVALQPRLSAGGGKTREDVIGEDAADIASRLPEDFDLQAINMQYPVQYEESMNTVLVQECIRFDSLLRAIKSSLIDLQKALRGMVVMSSELEAMGTNLYSQKVPSLWESKAYPSLKPLKSWTQELLERLSFVNTWVAEGKPKVFWLSGFFFPPAFLTGTMQNFARKYVLPIDNVAFDFHVVGVTQSEVTEAPEDGCYIYGLFLEGARWSNEHRSIVESRPKELFTEIPVMHFMPKENRQPPESGYYRCPVYKVLSRRGTLSTTGHSTNFVLWIEIPSTEPTMINNIGLADQQKWIKAGVAAFCSLKF